MRRNSLSMSRVSSLEMPKARVIEMLTTARIVTTPAAATRPEMTALAERHISA